MVLSRRKAILRAIRTMMSSGLRTDAFRLARRPSAPIGRQFVAADELPQHWRNWLERWPRSRHQRRWPHLLRLSATTSTFTGTNLAARFAPDWRGFYPTLTRKMIGPAILDID